MRGLEYLSVELVERLWCELRNLVADKAAAFPQGPAELLRQINPLWHLLGRVTLHLAENKRDEARPFAFLATYTHRMSPRARPVHLPLAEALKTYADANERARLEPLLAPVRRAAETSPVVRELLETRRQARQPGRHGPSARISGRAGPRRPAVDRRRTSPILRRDRGAGAVSRQMGRGRRPTTSAGPRSLAPAARRPDPPGPQDVRDAPQAAVASRPLPPPRPPALPPSRRTLPPGRPARPPNRARPRGRKPLPGPRPRRCENPPRRPLRSGRRGRRRPRAANRRPGSRAIGPRVTVHPRVRGDTHRRAPLRSRPAASNRCPARSCTRPVSAVP